MCGLFGWQWDPARQPSRSQRERVALALAIYNDRRGGHSWGFATAHAARTVGLGALAPRSMRLAPLGQVMAHTRFATVGAHSKANAHPFVTVEVTGAHNGVISNHGTLDKRYGDRAVDSMHLIEAIDQRRDLKEIQGYGAVEWAEGSRPGDLHLARVSSDGELAIAQTTCGVIWSSQKEALEASLSAAEIRAKHFYKVEAGAHLFARGGTLYTGDRDMMISPREVDPRWKDWRGDSGAWKVSDGYGWEESEPDPTEARSALIDIGFSQSDVWGLSDAEAIETAQDLTDFGG